MNNDFLRKIPGFRSNTWWKKIVAVAGYLYFFFLVFNQTGVTFFDRIINSLLVIVTYGTIFVLAFNVGNIRDKIYFFNRPKGKARIVFIFLGILITVVALNLVLSGLNSLKSEEQLQYEEDQNNVRIASYMDTRINGLGALEDLTEDDADALEEIINDYEKLTTEQKNLMTVNFNLQRAKEVLEELKE
ncbi:MAG TPA: hypothetical protein DHM42_09675 [Clostridiales bacterium]|jgi:hypothetical protein|nr:hypothetical protein [Clostridiales bacterium]